MPRIAGEIHAIANKDSVTRCRSPVARYLSPAVAGSGKLVAGNGKQVTRSVNTEVSSSSKGARLLESSSQTA
jgi:hypothetical protein